MIPFSGIKKVTLEDHFVEMNLGYKFDDENQEYREELFYVFYKRVSSEKPKYFILEKVVKADSSYDAPRLYSLEEIYGKPGHYRVKVYFEYCEEVKKINMFTANLHNMQVYLNSTDSIVDSSVRLINMRFHNGDFYAKPVSYAEVFDLQVVSSYDHAEIK